MIQSKKQRLAEIDLVIKNSEDLIAKTLGRLGITPHQFRLLRESAKSGNLLN